MLTSLFMIYAMHANASSLVPHFWRGQTMSEKEVRSKWGGSSFDSEKFRAGSLRDRASMAADLLGHPDPFLKMAPSAVRAKLGEPDGFYFRDSFPAYFIDDSPGSVWQIVFLLNKDYRVGNIIVHKNCCE